MRAAVLAASVLFVPALAAADQLCALPLGPDGALQGVPPARAAASVRSLPVPPSSAAPVGPPSLRTPGTPEPVPAHPSRADGAGPVVVPVQVPPRPGAASPFPTVTAASHPGVAATSDPAPALRHIVQAGATLTDIGTRHGLRTLVARQKDEVLLVQLAPDDEAVVTGLMSDLSVAQLKAAYAGLVTDLAPMHGLAGFFVRSGGSFQVFYATPDNERVIPGNMWDSAGHNLTRDQVSSIEGAIPTVSIIGPSTVRKALASPGNPGRPQSAIDALKHTTYGVAGSDTAPRLWMLVDPLCTFSLRALQELQDYVDKGRIQLAVIPLSILDHEDQGRSTDATLAMLTLPRDSMIDAWGKHELPGMPGAPPAAPPAPTAGSLLGVNMGVASGLGLRGTPTFFWHNADGTEGRFDGLPSNIGALVAQVGR